MTEQSGNTGSHGLQITNVLEPMPYGPPFSNFSTQQFCHTPILRTCNHDSSGDPWTANQTCRHYTVVSNWTPPGGRQSYGPFTTGCIIDYNTSQPLQIGDCFSWAHNNKVECIVGFSAIKGLTLQRYPTYCLECGQDNDNNGIDDCIDCNNLNWNGDIPGCLDCPNCSNYDPQATIDDGSCLGCTDNTAVNYEPNADMDDGSCNIDPNNIPGCTDQTAQNYDPNATVDDGSCIAHVYGCLDPTAVNYYPGVTAGCTPPSVDINDWSCCEYEGCNDPTALNYDPTHYGCNYDPNDTSCCTYSGIDPSGSIDPRDPVLDPEKPNKEVCCDWCATVVPDIPSTPPPGCEDWMCEWCESTEDPDDMPPIDRGLMERFQKLANIKIEGRDPLGCDNKECGSYWEMVPFQGNIYQDAIQFMPNPQTGEWLTECYGDCTCINKPGLDPLHGIVYGVNGQPLPKGFTGICRRGVTPKIK